MLANLVALKLNDDGFGDISSKLPNSIFLEPSLTWLTLMEMDVTKCLTLIK